MAAAEADVVLFAGITGDLNPAHVDQVWAEASRFGGHIAHGMLSAAFISTVARRHPEAWDLLGGSPLSRVGLNPQPLPPKEPKAAVAADLPLLTPQIGEAVSLSQKRVFDSWWEAYAD